MLQISFYFARLFPCSCSQNSQRQFRILSQNPFLSGVLSCFSVYFFTTSEEKLQLQYIVSVLIYLRTSPVSRHPAVLKRGQLHFSRTLLIPRITAAQGGRLFFFAGVIQQAFFFSSHYPSLGRSFLAAHIKFSTTLACLTHTLTNPALAWPHQGHAWYIYKTELLFS